MGCGPADLPPPLPEGHTDQRQLLDDRRQHPPAIQTTLGLRMRPMTYRSNQPAGMTLIELLVVLVIAAILAGVAWPSFTSAINKSRRADGISALAELTQAQERWRANHPTYQQNVANLPGARSASAPGHYSLAMVDGSATGSGFRARATAKVGSPQSNDSPCQVLEVELTVGTLLYRSYSSGDAGANATPDPCWVR